MKFPSLEKKEQICQNPRSNTQHRYPQGKVMRETLRKGKNKIPKEEEHKEKPTRLIPVKRNTLPQTRFNQRRNNSEQKAPRKAEKSSDLGVQGKPEGKDKERMKKPIPKRNPLQPKNSTGYTNLHNIQRSKHYKE
ncbi:hypothetical protein C922_05615 [Plasmodium inui San Antonio 1]|uniref:Uncharacterized protein n=1 Tax=Plasmodium inui San Antonio 1 TaxID=1237626 RepID=W6ZXI2_9APIC|nr:hypothetical protein C922_05615 [Plasmodium inui San Antonio 1]EUD64003.1 hypothetical protein C922_05615 [Plasmodium inui San Antonio 1]